MFRFKQFRFLYPYLRQEAAAYAWGAVLVLLTSAFLVAIPKIIGLAIERVVSGDDLDQVTLLALAMVGASVLRGITSFYMRTIMIGASRRIEARLRNHMFRHMESLDSAYFAGTHTGDLMTRFTSDVDAVRAVLGPGIMYSFSTIAILTLGLVLMFAISVQLTLYSLIPLGLLTVAIRTLSPRVHGESMRAQERLSEISVHAQENFSNVKVVKAFNREQAEIERMRTLSEGYFVQNMRLARLRSLTMGLLWLFGDLVVLSLVAFGGYELINGDLALHQFAEFKGYQLLLVWPMIALGWVMTLFQRGAASAERLRGILDAEPAINDERADRSAKVTEGALVVRAVSFAYPDKEPVLCAVDFQLDAGSTLGVVGATGSGKTTLLQLIPRLREASSGDILVDGHPIARLPLARLRDAVGVVPQEPFLFSATVEENIRFGVDEASAEQIAEVAQLVQIHDEILGFSHGYSQRVGERGITLSGGQKQRIALARALLKRPKILLLDDVLSAVDATTESEIIRGLRRRTADLTTIIVSHRLSSLRHADEIIVLEEGRVRERGTHAQLMTAGGYYAQVFRRQTIEDELENL